LVDQPHFHLGIAHANAVGKALLAHTPDTVERIINQGLPRLTELTITDPEDFRSELGRIRVEGLSTDREEAIPGFYCLAVTVGGHGGLPRLGLSLAGLTTQEVATHGALLRRVRVEIDRRLLALAS
ncbi:MAG: IclR family transcriptional regulator C-terminal domain-containing protein, partial [Propionibacteriaceae bacterium]|nr:IclR family transcriptional regulator C-terminal domain-containing protein [Propionibacteriaceae bacterium]